MKKARNGFIRNLHYLCLIGVIALGLMAIVGTGGGGGGDGGTGECVDVSGTWSTTEVVDDTGCGGIIYTEYNTYTVTQNGCNITVIPSDGGSFSGTVSGNQINWSGSWQEGGGTVTANISLTISGDSLSGSSSWTWSDGYSCPGTTQITGTRYSAPPPGDTSARFFNDVTCGGSLFTATLNLCGTTLTSQSGSWSSCQTVASGTCSWSVYADAGACGTISFSDSVSLNSGCIYDFVLDIDGGNVVLVCFTTCPGDCSSPTPFSVGTSLESLSDDDSFELLMEVPIEGEGLTRAQ
jgi:hypothetical protein